MSDRTVPRGPASTEPLDQPLVRLLGDRTAQRLEREFGMSTVRDLLEHFPRRWIERGELTPIAALPVGEQVTVVARVISVSRRQMRSRRGFLVDVTVTDDHPGRPVSLAMAFFNSHDALRRLSAGTRAMFHGKTAMYRGQLTLNNPDFTVLDEDSAPSTQDLGPVPVYPATGKVPSWVVRSSVETALGAVNWSAITDPVPPELLAEAAPDGGEPLPPLSEAYRQVHRPSSIGQARRALQRFAVQEALILQASLGLRRAASADATSRPWPDRPDGLRQALDDRLPFDLTPGQRRAGERIAADLSAGHPMSRLLQGEVGSGKTLVALRAMLQVVDGGGQAALVAPTEVLAQQHHRSLLQALGPLAEGGTLSAPDGPSTTVVLLTGSMSTAQRRTALLAIASGQAGIVVGTHALFADHVQFAELGLAVVDEQHRFGVDQREALRQANPGIHLLVMSATPIPRSVAMTVFGDLDLTVLEGLPSGRQPVATHVARMSHGPRVIARVWEVIAEQVAAGHQAFVVCPKIDPTDTLEDHAEPSAPADPELSGDGGGLEDRRHDASVEDMVPRLQGLPVLQGVSVAGLHGRMSPADQDEVMGGFVRGDLDVLVATTVVEVGVDVPNATVMAVLDADAFGLSTLHQLRGRVGRGGAASVCLLATRRPDGHPALERLEVLAGTQDGLEIARADLHQRGEGDITGAAQHGGSRLKVISVLRHAAVIELCADWVAVRLEQDGGLDGHTALLTAVRRWEQGHAEAADYLERG
ncbi:ATP-dependent DNA helicase RecG [Micrococcus terreus]|uniref:ATP-dependent DNA helicase RecG n=1 Tax=Micrococcus terreus TaxID=574650 RepID=A0A1I7MGN7_9MICC|nr:ATP-dependent DNA helicase RecG [Micrococcus terreus]SFV21087.1 ATP-dependent DNA helicase RecG [Micrococcus terreus]